MKDIGKKISLMPIHAYIMCFAALFSFASIFIPMFELVVQYKKQKTYSLLTILTSPKVSTALMSGQTLLSGLQHTSIRCLTSSLTIC